MAKTKERSLEERVARYARVGGDRRRSLYVAARKLAQPRTTFSRTHAARTINAGIEIPDRAGRLLVERSRFPEAVDLAAAANARLAGIGDPAAGRDANKRFLIPILDRAEITRESPYARFALRDDILRAVTRYLGVAPLLSSVNVYYSPPVTEGLVSSQLFHCDGDDTRQVKIFVLCTEVHSDNGPLTVMSATESDALRRKIGYEYRNRVTDEQVEQVLGSPELLEVVGPAGTSCLVDTSRCFHYGSRVETGAGARLAAIVQYVTPYSFMLPRDYRSWAPYAHLADASSSPLERLVLGVA